MKNKWIILPLLSLPLFLASCQSEGSSYTVYEGSEHTLEVTQSDSFKSVYQSGETFTSEGLTVSFDGTELSTGDYYFTSVPDYPRENKIEEGAAIQNSQSTSAVTIYAAYDVDTTTYVSEGIDLTVNNSSAVSPWVYYTVMGVVVVGVSLWLYFRSKAKKEGKA